jgi:hypothetical protein
MEQRMNAIDKYESFHDWYLIGAEVDLAQRGVVLNVLFDNRKDRARIVLSGATRCLMRDFLIQNIILSTKVLADFGSDEYCAALAALDKSYPWGRNRPHKSIVSIEATLGAELLIECDSFEVEPLESEAS